MAKISPASPEQVAMVDVGLAKLREARDLFASAHAPRVLARIEAALKSAEGAQRHVRRRRLATEIGEA